MMNEGIETYDTITYGDSLEVGIAYIPDLLSEDVAEMRDEENVKIEFTDKYADLASQHAFLVTVDTHIFKNAVRNVFPGGYFSKITGPNHEKTWGTLWASPAFNITDLIDYYEKFGCAVKPYKYKLHPVPIIPHNNSPLPDGEGCRNSP